MRFFKKINLYGSFSINTILVFCINGTGVSLLLSFSPFNAHERKKSKDAFVISCIDIFLFYDNSSSWQGTSPF